MSKVKTSEQSDTSASNAFNYSGLVKGSVNPRTGNLSVAISPPKLAGPLGVAITPNILKEQTDTLLDHYMLGLPLGWSYTFSYIYDSRVYINGKQSYYIDENYESGLKYYTLKNMKFSSIKGKWKDINYSNILSFSNGDNQYFDKYGRLIGIEDRYGNHVLFTYIGNDTVYNSKIKSITNVYGQVINFDYDINDELGVYVTYPLSYYSSSSAYTATFAYLRDKNGYLIAYKNALSENVSFENRGGLVKQNLISKITYPNELEIKYEYTTLNYFLDSSKTSTASLDCVSAVISTYQDQVRKVLYNYNPDGNDRNFTGYNDYACLAGDDMLLQEGSNFKYSTEVDDGVFVTRHTYNHLHLEMETCVYTKLQNSTDNFYKNKIVSKNINIYAGENSEGYFPPWPDLILQHPNYQTPLKIETTIYNDNAKSIIHLIETKFDGYGNSTETKKYQTDVTTGKPILFSKDETLYDYEHYGIITVKDMYDYSQDANSPVVRREVKTLTKDGKSVATSTNGILHGGTFSPSKMTTHEYDSEGRITYSKVEWVDGQDHGNLKSSESWTEYNLENFVLIITKIDAQNNKDITKTNAAMGLVISNIDPLGREVTYSYDKLGRTLSVTDPKGLTKKWTYDDKKNKITVHYNNGYELYNYYNGFGQLVMHCDNINVRGSERIISLKTYYNKTGQLHTEEGILGEKSRTTYVYDDRGNIASKTDALGNVFSYTYDPVLQTETIFFNGIKTNSSHSNLGTITKEAFSSTSPMLAVKSTGTINAYNKVVEQLLGDKASTSWIKSIYDYDVNLNVANMLTTGHDSVRMQTDMVRDLFGNEIYKKNSLNDGDKSSTAIGASYIYNKLNQLYEERNAINQSFIYTYDAAGQQITCQDYDGVNFNYNYDVDGKISSVVYNDKKGSNHVKKYEYYDLTRKLKSITDFVDNKIQSSLCYSYTNLDEQLSSVTYPDGKSISYIYDDYSRPFQFTDVMGQVTQYAYDDFGRISKIEILQTNYWASFLYYSKNEDPANSGLLKTVTISNGIQKQYSYNGFGLIENITVIDTKAPDGTNIVNKMTYTYDDTTHNIIGINYSSNVEPNNKILNYSVSYSYNSLNQIKNEKICDVYGKQISNTTYAYDAAANLLTEEITDEFQVITCNSYEYDADNKLIAMQKQIGTESPILTKFKYDVNGNLVDDGQGSIFIYNEENQLIKYQNINKNIIAVYSYYPDGMRANKKVNDYNAIQFYYDGSKIGLLVNETQGTKSTNYLISGNERFIRLVKDNDHINVQCALTNGKDTIGILGSNNKLEDTYLYAPYGEIKAGLATNLSDIIDNPFLYSSEYCDIESNLIYLRARYYNPKIKRFMSRDIMHLLNCYAYADSNPIMNVDPTGLFSFGEFFAGLAIAVVGIAIMIATGGTGAPAVAGLALGGAMIGGGVSGAAFGAQDKGNDWRNWGITFGIGAAFGTAGSLANVGFATAITSTVLRSLANAAFGAGLGVAEVAATNDAVYHNNFGVAEGLGAAAIGFVLGGLVEFGMSKRIGVYTEDMNIISRVNGENVVEGVAEKITLPKGRIVANFVTDRLKYDSRVFLRFWSRSSEVDNIFSEAEILIDVHGGRSGPDALSRTRDGARSRIPLATVATTLRKEFPGENVMLKACYSTSARAQSLSEQLEHVRVSYVDNRVVKFQLLGRNYYPMGLYNPSSTL